jgi:hypothetical protein
MSIHIDLSVDPHSKHCIFGADLKPTPESRPPHKLFEREFHTADEAFKFIAALGLNQEDFETAYSVIDAARLGEYVGVELELKELTATEYTSACLMIEGRQMPCWQTIKDETQRAMAYLMGSGEFKDVDVTPFLSMLNDAYAVSNAILQAGDKKISEIIVLKG